MKVSILTENTVYKRGFLAEHGLSLFIESEHGNYLFDTGQSHVFVHNAKKLQIQLERLDGIILSHGHYDHCGGMAYYNGLGIDAPVYIQGKSFERKYTENLKTKEIRYIGVDNEGNWQEIVQLHRLQGGCTQITEGVYLLSEIPYVTEFEPIPKGFWRDVIQESGPELLADVMEDEQLLVMESKQGLCVFAGCAHPGIINCLHYVKSAFPGMHIHSVVAGMHLKGCRQERLDKTIEALQELDIDVVLPLHCTGILAIAAIQKALGASCMLAEAGKQIEF